MKEIRGEKYIYLAMAYKLAKENGGSITIGNDNGFTGGHYYMRKFAIEKGDGGYSILFETKNGANFADFTRSFMVINIGKIPKFYERIEGNDNYSKRWIH